MITVVGSLKGGSGKSTVTFNLAVWLAMAERNVVAIDADPQATLTDVLDVRREEGFEPSIRLVELRRSTDRCGHGVDGEHASRGSVSRSGRRARSPQPGRHMVYATLYPICRFDLRRAQAGNVRLHQSRRYASRGQGIRRSCRRFGFVAGNTLSETASGAAYSLPPFVQ